MNKNIPLLLFFLLVALFYILTKGAYHKIVSDDLAEHAKTGLEDAGVFGKDITFDGLDGVVGDFETEDARNQALAAINKALPAGFIKGRLSEDIKDVEKPVVKKPVVAPVSTSKPTRPLPVVIKPPKKPIRIIPAAPVQRKPIRPTVTVPKVSKPVVDIPRVKGTLPPPANPRVVKPIRPFGTFKATPEMLKALDNAAVFFEADMANLDPASVDRLKLAVTALRGAKVPLELVGHAHPGVEDDYQKDLSDRRSNAVRDALVKLGVPATLITSSTAKVAPPVKPSLEYLRQMRRVDIRLK